jgi:CheY-like chemotaxis protein
MHICVRENGFDVAAEPNNNLTSSAIPIINMTNLDTEPESAPAIGAADYIVKANTPVQEVIQNISTIPNL